ncbi:hypothetical protein LTV02_15380 [Nocardia yamanashiensis]|uniref:hypothetical protein n=1 Tax=Nocardia yamanashiensis TaxID=209247 RepID=UPI001E37BE86|nr:hypothetical protein [Nocardia yamanashiensis]UGT44686.1 hypothetical protein LTV02_15380 [Nocardia yamanashiensis]
MSAADTVRHCLAQRNFRRHRSGGRLRRYMRLGPAGEQGGTALIRPVASRGSRGQG